MADFVLHIFENWQLGKICHGCGELVAIGERFTDVVLVSKTITLHIECLDQLHTLLGHFLVQIQPPQEEKVN